MKQCLKINGPKIRSFFFTCHIQNNNTQSDKTANVCHTPGCVYAAAGVLQYIDSTIEPCDDFYDFACGKFLSETTLTDEKVSVDTFSIARDKMQKQLHQLIDSPVENSDLEYNEIWILPMEFLTLIKIKY